MKPELVDATLRRRSSMDKISQPDCAARETLNFDLTDEFTGDSLSRDDQSQVFTFIIDNISEHDMMLLEPEYEYIPKSNLYIQDKPLPSLLDWGESELKPVSESYFIQSDPVVIPTENILTHHTNDMLDTFTKVNTVDISETQNYLQSAPTSVIVKNLNGSSVEQSHCQEYSEGAIDIAALVDMCFRDED